MDREVKRLKQSRIPIVKVRWNSRRGPEYTWEREDQMQKKYPLTVRYPVVLSLELILDAMWSLCAIVWDQTALSVNLFEISYCYCLLLQSCARDSNYCSYYCPLPPKVRRLLSLTTGLCGLVLIRSDSDSPDKDDFTKHISTPTSYITPPFIYANAILRAPSFFWIEPRIAGPPMLLQLLLRAGNNTPIHHHMIVTFATCYNGHRADSSTSDDSIRPGAFSL
ncbi:hypothetical protein Tco_1017158 [Tanacetum coccineum]|uniref:Reverse transcriptase domain-containing protein n=1 Tax=Tanacetum coccineum TaxID=301880 RepID=A0ABQ5FS36_9ASTR